MIFLILKAKVLEFKANIRIFIFGTSIKIALMLATIIDIKVIKIPTSFFAQQIVDIYENNNFIIYNFNKLSNLSFGVAYYVLYDQN